MSAKWRALQHRHRYTYSAILFPQSYIQSLNSLSSDSTSSSCSSNFFAELNSLISLNSTYAQVNHVKNVASAFGDLLSNGDEGSVSLAARFYLELLFLENSAPLHRTLVSVLAKCQNYRALVGGCFRSLCEEYSGEKGKRFCVSRVALSMMGSPKLGYLVEVVEECTVMVALDVVFGLNAVVSETIDWSWPSPIVMEQCQEALSCLYYLLQRYPSKFSDSNSSSSSLSPKDMNVLGMILNAILYILNSSAFSRDCFVSAGVSFCAAIQVCLNPEELGLFIMEGIFHRKTCISADNFDTESPDVKLKIPYDKNISNEIHKLCTLSRMCLIRGILTAVPRTVLNTHFSVSSDALDGGEAGSDGSYLNQTILYDAILPELCAYCENPVDSHFNFHALTVLQICLQQIKTSMLAKFSNKVQTYDPIPEEMGARILKIIWNNLEDPLSQTVKQVHLVFDLFLDIQSTLHWAEGSEKINSYLRKIAKDLLCLGPRCKGRYVPLASLTKRLGAKTVLDMSPDLLFETVLAYVDDDVCCAATSFLKCFLEYLRDEYWATHGVKAGYEIYRVHSLRPILYGLASGVSKLRSNLNTYAISILLQMDADCIFSMLSSISIEPSEEVNRMDCAVLTFVDMGLGVEQKVAILVSLLKVSRLLVLIDGDIDWSENSSEKQRVAMQENGYNSLHALFCIKGINVQVPVRWLVLALTHVDESLRIDAAESLFLNPKTSSLPSNLELSLMREAVPLNMRCCSTAFQMKWTSLFRKFFARVRTALERQFKQGCWRSLAYNNDNESYSCSGSEEDVRRAGNLLDFMRWLSSFLFFSCYPSSPYERKIMSMELILIMIDVWSIILPAEGNDTSLSADNFLTPYNRGFTLPVSTLMLVGSIVDSWDRLRENSFRILLNFPTPLPGISCPDMVQKVITWAKKLVGSPRVRESDAGALTLRLVFRKYVLELNWKVEISVNDVSSNSHPQLIDGAHQFCKASGPVIAYINSLISWLRTAVEEGEKDLSEACKRSFVHGILLALRYTFEELDWSSDAVFTAISDVKCALKMLLELVTRITSLALWVVSSDSMCLPGDSDDVYDDDIYQVEVSADTHDDSLPSSDGNAKVAKAILDSRPPEQIVMVGCWLAMKEVSLLLGTIIRKIPLPSDTPSLSTSDDSMPSSDMMLDVVQLEMIGSHFLEVLLKMKHNGAIDKTRAGFTALCNRLLCSNDPRLCKLTENWMEQLMERTVAKGQTVDDLLRRSAGIPAAFIAFFLSEPEGTPKKLLPRALRWLIDVAKKSLLDSPVSCNGTERFSSGILTKKKQDTISLQPPETYANGKTSKVRDEGVVPTVHAFNVLRAAFNDTNLGSDTSGYAAEALIISIRSFSSSYWEVRNSACQAYTSLVRRMIGFLNVHKRESARRALTGLEFFHRYPSLHPFLLHELKTATEFLGDGSYDQSLHTLASVVHPSLCPMLILLSRLKPSAITTETGDALDPFLYMPFIRRCSTQSNLRVRVLASKALTGLVSNEKLASVMLNIASTLPCMENQVLQNPVSSTLNSKTTFMSFNSIHGMLLQLSSLLETNCRNLADLSRKDRILDDLVHVLMMRSWIGRPRLCPCPILNASFLVVLDHMLGIARTCKMSKSFNSINNLLLELSLECLGVAALKWSTYYDPTIADLRKQAAISYLSCVFQVFQDVPEVVLQMPQKCTPSSPTLQIIPAEETAFAEIQERLVLWMSDASYEVRLAALKWLLQFLKLKDSAHGTNHQSHYGVKLIHNWAKSDLQTTLMGLLTMEKNHRCMQYILRILFTWNSLQFRILEDQNCVDGIYIGQMDMEAVFQFWNKLVSLYECAKHSKTKEAVICCMGICIKRLTCFFTNSFDVDERKKEKSGLGKSQSDRWDLSYECIKIFVGLIQKCSASSEPVNMRKAAVESIAACGMLEQAEFIGPLLINEIIASENANSCLEPKKAVNMHAGLVLDLWFSCIRLLEDEDVGIRQWLARNIQKRFVSRQFGSSGSVLVPTQVEKVIEWSFDFLSSIFGQWLDYFNFLARWVLNAANSRVPKGDLVRQVFDKEIDNHHEEKLLISQICCLNLEKLLLSKSIASVSSRKHRVRQICVEWRKKFCHQLASFGEGHIEIPGGGDWVGGLGNHKDAFLPLYGNLLGFYALSKCIISEEEAEDVQSLAYDLVELGRSIKPFLGNPLIYNLYILVVKLHERVNTGSVDHSIPSSKGEESWDNFDPYFLLR